MHCNEIFPVVYCFGSISGVLLLFAVLFFCTFTLSFLIMIDLRAFEAYWGILYRCANDSRGNGRYI